MIYWGSKILSYDKSWTKSHSASAAYKINRINIMNEKMPAERRAEKLNVNVHNIVVKIISAKKM